jgi:hypothetical protein
MALNLLDSASAGESFVQTSRPIHTVKFTYKSNCVRALTEAYVAKEQVERAQWLCVHLAN